MTSILGRTNDKALVRLAGPAHLAGKPSGVLAAAIMAQIELDYTQFVIEDDPEDIRCILTSCFPVSKQAKLLQSTVHQ